MTSAIRQILFSKKRLWTPAAIQTQLWLDAGDISTITIVSGAVSQWNDKSGNNRHFLQSNLNARPAYFVDSFGYGGIDFYLHNGLNNVQSAVIQFVICVTESRNATWANYHTSLDSSASRFGGLRESGNTGFHNSVFPSAAWEDGNPKTVALSGFSTIDTRHIIGYQAAAGQGNPASNFTIGNYIADSGGSGKEFETIALFSTPSVDIRQRLEGYLAHKRKMTANLANDHPYKLRPPYL